MKKIKPALVLNFYTQFQNTTYFLGGGTEEDKEVAEEEDLKGDMEGMSIAAQPGGQELKSEDSEPTEDEGTTKVVESGAFTISSTINRYGNFSYFSFDSLISQSLE